MPNLLDAIRSRKSSRWGIGTADVYVKALPGNMFDLSADAWEEMCQKAAETLTWCEDQAMVDEVVFSVLGEEGRDKLHNLDLPPLAKAKAEAVPGACMVFDTTLTTKDVDRDGDILDPGGAEIDPAGPLLFNHCSATAIGKLIKVLAANSKRVRTRQAVIDQPFPRDVAGLIEFGALRRVSHGFLPMEYEPRKGKGDEDEVEGWHIRRYEVMEISVVSVASNRGALIEAFDKLGPKAFVTDGVKGWLKSVYDERPVVIQGIELQKFNPGTAVSAPRLNAIVDAVVELDERVANREADKAVPKTKTVPGDPPNGSGDGAEGTWSRLKLSDFTDEQWDDLSASEQGRIAKHFAWKIPGDTFDDSLALGHHFPPDHAEAGKASLAGVRNALSRAGQVKPAITGGDLDRVTAHLRAHLPERAVTVADEYAPEVAEAIATRSVITTEEHLAVLQELFEANEIIEKYAGREMVASRYIGGTMLRHAVDCPITDCEELADFAAQLTKLCRHRITEHEHAATRRELAPLLEPSRLDAAIA